MPSAAKIEIILKAEVANATLRFEDAQAEYWRAAAQPEPDAVSKQKEDAAAAARNRARENLVAALHRFNEFVVNGLVPDDLNQA